MSKKKPTVSQADLDRVFEERMKQFQAQRAAKITSDANKAYVSFAVYDQVTGPCAREITKLLELMRVKYEVFTTYVAVNTPNSDASDDARNAITIEVEGEDPAIAAYIQKFIDNNYALPWKQQKTANP